MTTHMVIYRRPRPSARWEGNNPVRAATYQTFVRTGFVTAPKGGINYPIDYDCRKAWNDPLN